MFCFFVLSKLTYQVYCEKQRQSDSDGGYMTMYLLELKDFYTTVNFTVCKF